MKTSTLLFCVAVFSLFFQVPHPAAALESDAVTSPRARVSLITDVDTVEPGQSFQIALRFQLTKDWHIYWLNPGDAGQAPDIHVKTLDGISVSPVEWPTPIRLPEGPAMVFAYVGEPVLPLTLAVPLSENEQPIKIIVDADWLVCASFCIPEKGHFELTLPRASGAAVPSLQKPLIDKSLTLQASPSPFRATVSNDNVLRLAGSGLSNATVKDAWFFPEAWGAVDYAAPQPVTFEEQALSLHLKKGPIFDAAKDLTGILVLQSRDGAEKSFHVTASPEKETPAPPRAAAAGNVAAKLSAPHQAPGLLGLVLFALLGGLILNLMPCVFPILAMKALSIVRLSGTSRREVRFQALLYTLGVVTAFTALGLLMLTLRSTGHAVGWGFQFQSPAFVTLMAWFLFVLGLNLSGVFIVGGRLMGVGEGLASQKSAFGSFCTGLLAVLVATPCIAPFLGAAIVGALAASAAGLMLIFLSMGIGLAAPYLLLALFPRGASFLPRPGAWMEILREALAFPMYCAAAWLLWVLSCQDGTTGLAYALGGTVTLSIAAWLMGKTALQVRGRLIAKAFVCLAVLGTVFFFQEILHLKPITSPLSTAAQSSDGFASEAFSPERLKALNSAGTPVFVDMTAAWCITCLVNEHVAIDDPSVKKMFRDRGITFMKGDWTQQDASITAFLKEHGSEGVPLYIYYPGHEQATATLPQILTPAIILSVISKTSN